MEIKLEKNCCIIKPLSPKLDERETVRLEEELRNDSHYRIALDLSYVQDCTIDFINKIKEYKGISLFNIHSDIFAILTSMNLDKSLNLFVSELDFLNDKRQLLNRHFSLV